MTDEEMRKALADNVMSGDVEMSDGPDGEPRYRLTAKGKERIEQKMRESGIDIERMKSDPEYAEAVMVAVINAPTPEEK